MVTKDGRSGEALGALRAHVGDAPADGQLRERLEALAANRTVRLSPGGQLLVWRRSRGVWAIGGASTALVVASVFESGALAAFELAGWLETKVAGSSGDPFPFAARNVKSLAREWRSGAGDSLQTAIALIRGDYDEARGTEDRTNVELARAIRDAVAARDEIARRAETGGYGTDPPHRLVKDDEVEFDVTDWPRYQSPFAGDDPPRHGETVTLRGTLSGHPGRHRDATSVPFARGTLTWSTPDGRHGPMSSRYDSAWVFSSGRAAYRDPVVFRRRDPDIDSAGIGTWAASKAQELGEAYGMTAEQLAVLEAAVADAGTGALWAGMYAQYAREAAADYHRAKPAVLDAAGMQVRAQLDEYAARGELSHRMERGDVTNATLLAAVAAERRRRRLRRPDSGYLRGPAVATSLREGRTEEAEISRSERRGALDYAQARAVAVAGWMHRTDELAADLAAWRRVAEELKEGRRGRR